MHDYSNEDNHAYNERKQCLKDKIMKKILQNMP